MIIVSGTPGTGKSTLSRQLATIIDYEYIDLHALIKEKKLYESYDKSADTYDVSIEKLIPVIKTFSEQTIIESHMGHELPTELIKKCIICTCDISVLKQRLEERNYTKKKIRDNIDAEIFDMCFIDAIESGKEVLKIDCTKKITEKEFKKISEFVIN